MVKRITAFILVLGLIISSTVGVYAGELAEQGITASGECGEKLTWDLEYGIYGNLQDQPDIFGNGKTQ